jgi:hypothetical protein
LALIAVHNPVKPPPTITKPVEISLAKPGAAFGLDYESNQNDFGLALEIASFASWDVTRP